MSAKSRLQLFCLALVSILVASCGSNPQKAGPRETAEAFFKAIQFGDYEKAKTYCSEGTAKNLALMETMNNLGANPMAEEATITNVEEDGNYASVTYDQGDEEGKILQLRKDEGEWVVVMSKTEMGGSKKPDPSLDLPSDSDNEPKVSPAEKYQSFRAGKSAEEVAKEFAKALSYGDYDAAMRYGSESTNDMLDYQKSMAALDDDKKETVERSIVRVEMDGDFAKAYYKESGKKEEKVMNLAKDDNGNWEVIMTKAEMGEE